MPTTTPPVSAADADAPGSVRTDRRGSSSFASRAVRAVVSEAYALPLVWLAALVVFMVLPSTSAQFTSIQTYAVIVGVQSVPLLLAFAVLVPMIGQDYDLSTPNTLLLSSMLVASLTVRNGLPLWFAIAMALVLGVVIGIVNGLLCAVLGLDSFIVTLGTGSFLFGVTVWLSDNNIVSGVSPALSDFFVLRVFSLPVEFYIAILLAAVIWWWIRYMPSGRRLTYSGDSRNVARLSGVRVSRVRIGAFCVSGLIAALAGVANVAQAGSADPAGNPNLLLAGFAAVFLGGTTITPGRFNAWGTVVAMLFLGTGVTALQIVGLQSYVQQIFFGAALVGGVGFARLAARRRALREEREALLEHPAVVAPTHQN